MSSLDNIQEFAEQFENETLPKSLWTHEAHLAVGLYYVLNDGKDEALRKLRVNIRKYNIATGGENTETNGYHETITAFWVWSLNRFLETADKNLPIEELFQQLLWDKHSDKYFPLEYYSKEHLLSTASRLNYAAPDLKPFD